MSAPSPELPPLDTARAAALVGRFASCKLVIVGDVMLDQFLIGRVNRISPEAPVPVVEFDHEEHRLGGAANVANNVRALGAAVELIGVIGKDIAGDHLLADMRARGLGVAGLVTAEGRRTTTKVRLVTTRNQQVARIDYESDADLDPALEEALAAQLASRGEGAGAIIVSDYLKGVVTRRVVASVVAWAGPRGIPVLVDPKIPHLGYYAGATLVTPNNLEAETATHLRIRTDDDARDAARLLVERAGTAGALVTRGEHGMWLSHGEFEGRLPATAREVADVTGAGDTVIATLALGLAAGATSAEAARLANEAAGVVVGKFGPATVSPDELLARF
ncbi:MAG: D-glycero-beta-D-manno-heptose-7-phosphate kinase [Vicinamibacterales bacterium]